MSHFQLYTAVHTFISLSLHVAEKLHADRQCTRAEREHTDEINSCWIRPYPHQQK